jgi:hypothetical protein
VRARILALIAAAGFAGCHSEPALDPESRSPGASGPVGLPFPSVEGRSLAGESVRLPDDFLGAPSVVLIGYQQRAQFDADRWLFGLLQADLDLRIVELPTIPGWAASLASRWIDEGMRGGIPQEDWSSVVTLYGGEAAPVAEFTGTEGGNNVRVLLLDGGGVVRWFHDRGFSAGKLKELADARSVLENSPPAAR